MTEQEALDNVNGILSIRMRRDLDGKWESDHFIDRDYLMLPEPLTDQDLRDLADAFYVLAKAVSAEPQVPKREIGRLRAIDWFWNTSARGPGGARQRGPPQRAHMVRQERARRMTFLTLPVRNSYRDKTIRRRRVPAWRIIDWDATWGPADEDPDPTPGREGEDTETIVSVELAGEQRCLYVAMSTDEFDALMRQVPNATAIGGPPIEDCRTCARAGELATSERCAACLQAVGTPWFPGYLAP